MTLVRTAISRPQLSVLAPRRKGAAKSDRSNQGPTIATFDLQSHVTKGDRVMTRSPLDTFETSNHAAGAPDDMTGR